MKLKKNRIVTFCCTFMIVFSLSLFCFWCGYKVGAYERDWEKNHPIKIELQMEMPSHIV